MVRKSHQWSADSRAEDLHTYTNISTQTVRRELHEMGFHDRAAPCKPHITKNNAEHQMEWSKAHKHWTLEQWKPVLWSDQSRSDGWVWVWRPLPAWLHCADCKVCWRRDNGMGLFFMGWARLLTSAYQVILDNTMLPTLNSLLMKALFYSSLTVPQCPGEKKYTSIMYLKCSISTH